MAQEIGLLKKITLRTVFGGKGDVLETVMKDKQKEHMLMRVHGFANGIREAESREVGQDGEKIKSKGLVGEFEATNLVTGEAFFSPVCWLPQMAVDLVAGQLGEEDARVGFAYDIGVVYSEASATSYEYTVRPLTKLQETDAMTTLKNSLPPLEATKALSAPENSAKE